MEADLDEFLRGVQMSAYRMAQLATQSRDEALDVVQDAMLRFVHRYRAKPPEQWRPLFYKVLHSGIMDWHRRRKLRSLFSWFGGQEGLPEMEWQDQSAVVSQPVSPERLHEASRAMRELDDALRRIPLRQRQAVLLRLWQGLNTEETALVMGISNGSVKTHLSRGLQSLRRQLGEYRL